MIRLKNIDLSLPGFSLKGINLDIQKNDFFSLIGPTGSGKSLLLEGMMGLIPFTGGALFLENQEITNFAVEKRNLAIVYQDFALFPHLDVTQNIFYGISYHKIPKNIALQRFDSLVSTLGLDKIIKRQPHNLSGGEKQRVALARSLILNPNVLLLDEPLSALDPNFHEEAKELLKKIHDDMEITIIMVSHNFTDVLYLANRGAIIKDGRIMQQGEIMDLFEKPNSRFTAAFVGMKNIIPICNPNGEIFLKQYDINISYGSESFHKTEYIGIRPENIFIIDDNSKAVENYFSGKIRKISSHGFFLNVSLQTANFEFEAIWPRNHMRDYALDVGKRVSFGFHSQSVHAF